MSEDSVARIVWAIAFAAGMIVLAWRTSRRVDAELAERARWTDAVLAELRAETETLIADQARYMADEARRSEDRARRAEEMLARSEAEARARWAELVALSREQGIDLPDDPADYDDDSEDDPRPARALPPTAPGV